MEINYKNLSAIIVFIIILIVVIIKISIRNSALSNRIDQIELKNREINKKIDTLNIDYTKEAIKREKDLKIRDSVDKKHAQLILIQSLDLNSLKTVKARVAKISDDSIFIVLKRDYVEDSILNIHH